VTEELVRGDEHADAELAAIALVRRPAGADVASFVSGYEKTELPRLLDAVRAPTWCLQNRALRGGGSEPAFDVVTQVHAAAKGSLETWAKELAATGASVVAVTVTEHPSALPW
jgi:hypothetical protein